MVGLMALADDVKKQNADMTDTKPYYGFHNPASLDNVLVAV